MCGASVMRSRLTSKSCSRAWRPARTVDCAGDCPLWDWAELEMVVGLTGRRKVAVPQNRGHRGTRRIADIRERAPQLFGVLNGDDPVSVDIGVCLAFLVLIALLRHREVEADLIPAPRAELHRILLACSEAVGVRDLDEK